MKGLRFSQWAELVHLELDHWRLDHLSMGHDLVLLVTEETLNVLHGEGVYTVWGMPLTSVPFGTRPMLDVRALGELAEPDRLLGLQ